MDTLPPSQEVVFQRCPRAKNPPMINGVEDLNSTSPHKGKKKLLIKL